MNGRARGLTDSAAVALALAAGLGAWVAVPGVGPIGLGALLAAFALRRPSLLILGAALVASAGAAHATAGLVIAGGTWRGEVEVLHVATDATGDVHAEVRAGAHHLDLVPTPADHASIARANSGDRLDVAGRVTPIDPTVSRSRGSHVAGRLHAWRVAAAGSPRPAWRVAGRVRDAVHRLGRPLPRQQRALFDGFVLGDASAQSDLQRADFRASGLTHLLVASGENIAFVLVLAGPLLRRSGTAGRWTLTLTLCGLYALVTGLEPSVLRAATMAVVATSAAGLGRPVKSPRSLAIAVTLLVLGDPFLVHSAAFTLSVGASIGILALARPLAASLPGPPWLANPLAVTVAAQIGVAPVLIGFPGGMPVAAIPANVLVAVPAGLVMVAGLPALVLAATTLPGTGAFVLVPRALLGYIDGVARVCASLPLGYLGTATVAIVTFGAATVAVVGRDRLAWLRRGAMALVVTGMCTPVLFGAAGMAAPMAGPAPVVVRRGATVVVVLTGPVPTQALLSDLSAARVRRIDAVVVPHGDAVDTKMLAAIAHRHRVGRVFTPRRPEPPVPPWPVTVLTDRTQVLVGTATLQVIATTPVLTVDVE